MRKSFGPYWILLQMVLKTCGKIPSTNQGLNGLNISHFQEAEFWLALVLHLLF